MSEAYSEKDESTHPAIVQVNRIAKQRDALADLCGKMLATLALEANKDETIGKLNAVCLAGWKKVFAANEGDLTGEAV